MSLDEQLRKTAEDLFDQWWLSEGHEPWHRVTPVSAFEAGMKAADGVLDALEELHLASGQIVLGDQDGGRIERLIEARKSAYALLQRRAAVRAAEALRGR
jgi:hypothetical protein